MTAPLPSFTDRELQARTMLATWIQTRDGRLITRAYETLGGVLTGEGMEPTPYAAPTRLHERVAAQDSGGSGNALCGQIRGNEGVGG